MPLKIKKLYGLFNRKEKLKLIGLFCMMMVAALFEVVGIGLIPGFISIITEPNKLMEYGIGQKLLGIFNITNPREFLIWGAIILISTFIIKNIYMVWYYYIQSRFVNNQMYHISHRLMHSYMQAPYTFHLQRNTAELLRNIRDESSLVIGKVIMPLLIIILDGIMTLSIISFLLLIEPLITVMVFLVLGSAVGFFVLATSKRLKQYGFEEQGFRSEMNKSINQGLGSIKDARILNRESYFVEKFRYSVFKQTRLLAKRQFISQIPLPVIETLAIVGMMSVVLIMLWQGRNIASIIPVLSLFAVAVVRLMPSLNRVASNYSQFRYNLVSVNPIYDDLLELSEYRSSVSNDRKTNDKLPFDEKIAVRNVYYNYPNSTIPVINGVSFEIKKGEAVAFVGPSGAGKTTIIDNILGLLEPQKGEIHVDGLNIYDHLSSWQQHIGYIPQSIYLSDETLRCNVAFGVPEKEIDDDKVLNALKLAQLEELLSQMPKGLETIVGENGILLSGGQRQRIGIARALYHDPQVLVMDEATAALDNVTERHIMKAIETLKNDRTTIIIAHRLTTVRNCDTIFMMKEGEVISTGTYDELLENSSDFKNMNTF